MMLNGKPNRLNSVLLVGFFLGIGGSFLDFFSGYLVLSQPAMPESNTMIPSGLAWGIGISVLGAVLLVTAFASLSAFGMRRMKTFGSLMALYGLVMVLIGISMYWGVTPMMQGASLSGVGMLAVGGLMLLSGPSMLRSQKTTTSPKMGHGARNVSLIVGGVIIVAALLLVADPAVLQGLSGGMHTSSGTTSTQTSTNSLLQVAAGAASCSGSGKSEQCNLTLVNSGTSGTTITGAGTLSYNGAGGMGTNTVTTSSGCTVLTGTLGPGQSAHVKCVYTVSELAASGSQLSGSIALSGGDSVSFLGTTS